jgi:hypothetical protein
LHQLLGHLGRRHSAAIAQAIAERLAQIRPPPEDPTPALPRSRSRDGRRDLAGIDTDLKAGGSADITERLRGAPRVVKQGHADTCPDRHPLFIAGRAYCRRRSVRSASQFLEDMKGVLGTDRRPLAIPMPSREARGQRSPGLFHGSSQAWSWLNWLQPHEGNIVEFLFRERAFQTATLPYIHGWR